MMNRSSNKQKSNKVQAIINRINEEEKNEALSVFALQYLNNFAPDDLSSLDLEDLYTLVLSTWKFIYVRKPNERKVRVHNPKQKNFTHTVIEVCCKDMPFLVDSIRMEVNRRGFLVHYMVNLGGIKLIRNQKNQIESVKPESYYADETSAEALLHLEIDRQTNKALIDEVTQSIQNVLADVACAVEDWHLMRLKLKQVLSELNHLHSSINPSEVAEAKDFLRWIDSDHFTFLGYREYDYLKKDGEMIMQLRAKSGLGVLRNATESKQVRNFMDMPEIVRERALSKQVLIIAKTNTQSTVHRDAYTDYIGVKFFDDKGQPIGERQFIGLYTSVAYYGNPRHIPFLRHKVAEVMKLSNLSSKGHTSKTFLNILEMLPRDDLFQGSAQELLDIAMGVLHLQERQRTRLFIRKDAYGRYLSCLIFVPKDRFNTELRKRFQHILENELHGIVSNFNTTFSDSMLARIHIVLRIDPTLDHPFNVKHIEKQLIKETRSWEDNLHDKLIEVYDEGLGVSYFHKYKTAFPEGYKEQYNAHTAARDIYHMETISKSHPLDMSFYRSVYKGRQVLRFKLFNRSHTMPLSDVLPLLENMGLRVLGERPNEILISETHTVWINDFDLIYDETEALDLQAVKANFQEAFAAIWLGRCENDGFNRLVLKAGLSWRETSVLRAYAHYLQQLGFTYSQFYIEETFVNHVAIVRELVDLFKLRFDPDIKTRNIEKCTKKIEKSFDQVANLDQDRILRRYLELINATLRTNYYQLGDCACSKEYLAFKLAPELIPDIPSPIPLYEAFVFSPRFAGVHLRMAKVARGGIRWSDRREDYRTEVLGLMKAQQVKNAVIVPMGAKGGFYAKKLGFCKDRDAFMQEGIACYKLFISGLLDVVDNMQNGKVIHPENTICYDGEDPYLVVAADKGTASFSDIANGIANDYGYWLSDAFASGGSMGYDHKKMGITARGAWESVKRNFRELSRLNTQKDCFTVIGIGDMAGDVFGNGMLQSKKLQLIAAFNHMHIFIDPSPDPEKSYQERSRLFKLERSTWDDYDRTILSPGGGIFKRTDKIIVLTDEIKRCLDVKKDAMHPEELIRSILMAPVDLLWNGGVGTFVKSCNELHVDAGDKQNDIIRINANQLRVKIVGEGGNLGFTQLARVEFAQAGGYIYTDFVDNSAGVDCSDHEVNIKILLSQAVANGKLTEKERNKLLSDMSNDVAKLVLRNNYLQTQSITFSTGRSAVMIDAYRRLINSWEKSGKLSRELTQLPNNKLLQMRKANKLGMYKPEVALLLSYTKITLKKNLLESGIPEDADFNEFLYSAFPDVLHENYKNEMAKHNLRREIIATQVSNFISNRMGINFIGRMSHEVGCSEADAVRAFVCTVKVFDLEALWLEIEKLDYKVAAEVQRKMLESTYFIARRATRWFLKNHRKGINIKIIVKHFKGPIDDIKGCLPDCLNGYDLVLYKDAIKELVSQKVPRELSMKVALCSVLFSALDIVEASKIDRYSHKLLTNIYYQVGQKLSLGMLRQNIIKQPIDTQWDERIRFSLLDDLDWQQRKLSVNVLSLEPRRDDLNQQIAAWFTLHEDTVNRWLQLMSDVNSSNVSGFTMYSVSLRVLLELAQFTK